MPSLGMAVAAAVVAKVAGSGWLGHLLRQSGRDRRCAGQQEASGRNVDFDRGSANSLGETRSFGENPGDWNCRIAATYARY
jgi:hypothetical protein